MAAAAAETSDQVALSIAVRMGRNHRSLLLLHSLLPPSRPPVKGRARLHQASPMAESVEGDRSTAAAVADCNIVAERLRTRFEQRFAAVERRPGNRRTLAEALRSPGLARSEGSLNF